MARLLCSPGDFGCWAAIHSYKSLKECQKATEDHGGPLPVPKMRLCDLAGTATRLDYDDYDDYYSTSSSPDESPDNDHGSVTAAGAPQVTPRGAGRTGTPAGSTRRSSARIRSSAGSTPLADTPADAPGRVTRSRSAASTPLAGAPAGQTPRSSARRGAAATRRPEK